MFVVEVNTRDLQKAKLLLHFYELLEIP